MKTEKFIDRPRREDRAIEEFCRILSSIERHEVVIKSRPDNRGRTGQAKPDAIIGRGSEDFTLEHTSLMSYGRGEGKKTNKHHEHLFKRYVKPLSIEQEIEAHYPGYWISIDLPLGAFDEKFDYESTFHLLKQKLIMAVGNTPESYNCSEKKKFEFEGVPFPVWIARTQYGTWCSIILVAPVDRHEVHRHIEDEIVRAISTKREKLIQAKIEGARTILLLDSDDYSFMNIHILATAFKNAYPRMELEGIDEIFVIHGVSTAMWIAPLKFDNQLYPGLSEFDEYMMRQRDMRV